MWSRSGRPLFFESLESHIMVAGYSVQGKSFMSGKPRVWSEKRLFGNVTQAQSADLTPDGKRMVALMPAEGGDAQQPQNHVVFLENFFDELRRRVPETTPSRQIGSDPD